MTPRVYPGTWHSAQQQSGSGASEPTSRPEVPEGGSARRECNDGLRDHHHQVLVRCEPREANTAARAAHRRRGQDLDAPAGGSESLRSPSSRGGAAPAIPFNPAATGTLMDPRAMRRRVLVDFRRGPVRRLADSLGADRVDGRASATARSSRAPALGARCANRSQCSRTRSGTSARKRSVPRSRAARPPR